MRTFGKFTEPVFAYHRTVAQVAIVKLGAVQVSLATTSTRFTGAYTQRTRVSNGAGIAVIAGTLVRSVNTPRVGITRIRRTRIGVVTCQHLIVGRNTLTIHTYGEKGACVGIVAFT